MPIISAYKQFYQLGLQPKLDKIFAKQLRARCNQQLEHYPKKAGKYPLQLKNLTYKPLLNNYQRPVYKLALQQE